MAKERNATDKMNVALEGISSCLTVLKAVPEGAREGVLKKAQEYLEEANDELLTIRFHRNQI